MFEIKHCMSQKELIGWSKYLALEPFNSTEIQLALLSQMVSSFGGGKSKLQDFLITQYKGKPSTTPEFASEESILQAFSLLSTS